MVGQPVERVPVSGAHPTARDFVEQLTVWEFRRRREDGVHVLFRGPHGGTLRVLRSLYGRADVGLVEKAARLAGVTPEQFWIGPSDPAPDPSGIPASAEPPRTSLAGAPPASSHSPTSAAAAETLPRQRRRPGGGVHDRITSVVLAAHTAVDRPLGFDQVVQLCGGRVIRSQVSAASARLCRDGDLDRVRSGVYQWAGGVRSSHLGRPRQPAAAAPATAPTPLLQAEPAAAELAPPGKLGTGTPAADLFSWLFPEGVQMTAELLADLERWTQLTEKLVDRARPS